VVYTAHLTVCIIIWALLLLIVPFQRIKALWPVMVISILWMVLIDNLMTSLGYYSFENNWLPIGRVSVFQLFAYAGVGVLMVNWLNDKPASKLGAILVVAILFSLLTYFYGQAGAFRLERFDAVVYFVYCIAALSVYLWLTLTIAGEQRIYAGSSKTRGFILSD
jgi:hypothetical protein